MHDKLSDALRHNRYVGIDVVLMIAQIKSAIRVEGDESRRRQLAKAGLELNKILLNELR